MKIKIGTKTGKEFFIDGIVGFKDFRECANAITNTENFVVFNQVAIKASEIEYIAEEK